MSLLQSLIPSLARANTSCETAESAARSQLPGIRPFSETKESAEAWNLTVYLPGVNKSDLSITDEAGVLTICGERSWKNSSGWTPLYRETSDRAFELNLRHEGTVDVDRIRAELVDGVLRLTLPKTEAQKPRKIAVS